jgi:hypothetical protein
MTINDIILLTHWDSASGAAARTFHTRVEAASAVRVGGGLAFHRYSSTPNTLSRRTWRTLVRLAAPGPEEDKRERWNGARAGNGDKYETV